MSKLYNIVSICFKWGKDNVANDEEQKGKCEKEITLYDYTSYT